MTIEQNYETVIKVTAKTAETIEKVVNTSIWTLLNQENQYWGWRMEKLKTQVGKITEKWSTTAKYNNTRGIKEGGGYEIIEVTFANATGLITKQWNGDLYWD